MADLIKRGKLVFVTLAVRMLKSHIMTFAKRAKFSSENYRESKKLIFLLITLKND